MQRLETGPAGIFGTKLTPLRKCAFCLENRNQGRWDTVSAHGPDADKPLALHSLLTLHPVAWIICKAHYL